MQARRKQGKTIEILREKTKQTQSTILYFAKLSFESAGQIVSQTEMKGIYC